MTIEPVPTPVPTPTPNPTPEPTPTPDPNPTPNPDPTPNPVAVQADWPADWRDRMAGDDKDFRKALDRFNAPGDVGKSWKEISAKVSSGEYKKAIPFPEKGTPEQITAWRKENGIPETVEAYLKDAAPEGLVIAEAEKPIYDEFFKKMHEQNASPAETKKALSAYLAIEQAAQTKAVEEDRAFQQQTTQALMQEWGNEYTPNIKMVENFAKTRFGEEVGNAMLQAGPDTVKALAGIAREINPAMTLVPNSNNPNQAIATELQELNKKIGTPEWYANPAWGERYKQLIDGQAAMKR